MQSTTASVIEPGALENLVEVLRSRGFRVLGPTVRDGAIVYDDLASAAELPIGWKDVQEPGRYRLERRDDDARFGYAVGPHSWKQFLFPPRLRLWAREPHRQGLRGRRREPPPDRRLALIGVRACELHGIAIQDTVFLGGPHTDDEYASRRKDAFVVAVNCFEPAGTCFCVSMGTGPKAESGYDLALTEVIDGPHRLVVEVGSERGAARARRAAAPRRRPPPTSTPPGRRWPARPSRWAARSTPTTCPACSTRNLEHPRWDDVADRCLTCGNCTLVCPTCFCSGVEDAHRPDRRARRAACGVWDSCFSVEHSYMHGGRDPARPALALPPVADAQARRPGSTSSAARAASAAVAASPGARSASTSPRRLAAIRADEEARQRHEDHRRARGRGAALRRPEPRPARARSRAAAATCTSQTARRCFARTRPPTRSTSCAHGSIALETYVPGRGSITIETLVAGDVVGWSWLFPPYRWQFDARALELGAGGRVRHAPACATSSTTDPALGYDLMTRFAQVLPRAPAGDPAPTPRRVRRRPLRLRRRRRADDDAAAVRGRPAAAARPPASWTLELEPVDGEPLHALAGQFTMVYAFGVGEVPISISRRRRRPA